jgi:uncharacterized protein with NAD-binding domain and iron-sulfur cluster
MSTLNELEQAAHTAVAAVRDDAEARLKMREQFYAKYPGPGKVAPGFGRSELDFMRWEIRRGTLAPIVALDPKVERGAQGGSPWWRAVNLRLVYHAELASLIHERAPDLSPGMTAVRAWLEYIRNPSPKSWYRAHNSSIVDGYLDSVDLAQAEPWSERVFVNIVLYRLLYAQAMVEGADFGRLGEFLADPIGYAVDCLVHVPAFYPDHYPLTKAEVRDILQKAHTLPDEAAAALDDLFVLPQLGELYLEASGWLGQPGLELLDRGGLPSYPDMPSQDQGGPDREPPPKPGPKRKVAILGGGLASLAAAYELTNYDGFRDKFEVTLYQIGWRVGGKTANGFGPADRIEERGIHIFQGWYANAFRMVQDAYAYMEKHNLAPDSPLPKWSDAFVPDDATLFTEQDAKGAWTNWPIIFPYNDKVPGTEGPPPLPEVLHEALGLMLQLVVGSPYREHQGLFSRIFSKWMIDKFFTPPWEQSAEGWWKHLAKLSDDRHTAEDRPEVRWLSHAKDLLKGMGESPTVKLGPIEVSALRAAVMLFSGFVELLRLAAPEDQATNSKLEHIVVLGEYGLANMRGLLHDCYDEKTHQFDFHKINGKDYRDWLLANGLPQKYADSAPVRFIYCGCFHNLYGKEPGRLAADMGLRSLLESVTYRGSLVWKLVAGTGGSLTAPLYKMLAHRGVKFAFFRDVQEIHWSPGKEIEAITLGVQVDLAPGRTEYAPLKTVKKLDGWPSRPHYDQLNPGQAQLLMEGDVDLESTWAKWHPVRTEVLRRGVHFDDIINGIPIGATAKICAGIVKNSKSDAWRNMVKYVRTTPTLGVQIWLRPNLRELGYEPAEWGMAGYDEPNTVIYADLLYSWTDMGVVMPFEGWKPDEQPGQLSYYCGTWPLDKPLPPASDHDFPKREHARLIEVSKVWLGENMGWFMPKAIRGEKQFDLSLLVDPGDPQNGRDTPGDERLRAQWFIPNVEPSNHYTLAWPGSDQFRLAADQSGFDNLFLAGDWTDFGLNIGHVEGAVVSGLKAAQALLRRQGHEQLRAPFAPVTAGA